MARSNVFVDSCAFVALANSRDQHYEAAVDIFTAQLPKAHLHTSDYVLDEVVTLLNARCGRTAAVDALDRIMGTRLVELIVIDRPTLERAAERYRSCSVREASFTDVTSCVLLDQLETREVFSFDGHFRKLGYHLLEVQ
jgi:predicted nucleic acid-binding protein